MLNFMVSTVAADGVARKNVEPVCAMVYDGQTRLPHRHETGTEHI